MDLGTTSTVTDQGPVEEAIQTISSDGNLLLRISDTRRGSVIYYRVSVVALREASAYFDNLLNPEKFSEGAAVKSRLTTLHEQYGTLSLIPSSKLPVVQISDVGQYPKSASNKAVVTQFLKILHDPLTADLTASNTSYIALLAIVADRFADNAPVAAFVRQRGWNDGRQAGSDAKEIKRNSATPGKETFWRQRLLIGLLLDFDDWVSRYSSLLINSGSDKWITGSPPSDRDADALWWSLPGGVEEELTYRRECVLATISSLQSHFLTLYASKQRQCKLGYDSSPQCDSFQLGEMVRFFTRKGTLALQSMIIDSEYSQPPPQPPLPYPRPVDELLTTLRECPAYQIDRNHTHCGLRTKFLPALEYIRAQSQSQSSQAVGLCLRCWKEDRRKQSWLESPAGGTWRFKAPFGARRSSGVCGVDHRSAKAMFTAELRDWTPLP
ncbi:hypothetical protein MMC24_002938 [Lignoscripta atroalba]|nr:hypothetical protein [Lignoscripta atroalba]